MDCSLLRTLVRRYVSDTLGRGRGWNRDPDRGSRPGTSRRPVSAVLHLRSARPTRVGSCSPVDPGVKGHPSRGFALSCSGAGPRGGQGPTGGCLQGFGEAGEPLPGSQK